MSNNYIMLEARNIDVFYGEFQAIKNVNMKIKKNAVTAFIGPSGCGKSTFLRVLNRMNDYVEGFGLRGEITINGEKIYRKSVEVEELRKEVPCKCHCLLYTSDAADDTQ